MLIESADLECSWKLGHVRYIDFIDILYYLEMVCCLICFKFFYLVATLKMKITDSWMEAQIHPFSIVTNDVLCSWVLIVTSCHKFLQPVVYVE